MKTYDIVIVGGAVTGGTLALAFHHRSASLSIAVVESQPFDPEQQGGFDARSIALSLGSIDILKQYELWDDLRPFTTAITQIHVSERGGFGMTSIEAKKLSMDALGYVVELSKIGQLYCRKFTESANIDFLCPDSITELTQKKDIVEVTLLQHSPIQARLVVAADGTASQSCQCLGIQTAFEDYGQVAIVANVTVDAYHNGQAFERFTPQGPIALLPIDSERMSLVWCVNSECSRELMSKTDEQFLNDLQEQFGWRLGKMNQVKGRYCYPLGLSAKQSVISHRFAVVGNAAQTLHPIAGQGFNLGIRDVASLVDEVCRNNLDDVGEYHRLSRYQSRRESDKGKTINLTSSLVYLFSNSWVAMKLGRNIGLLASDNFSILQQPLLRRTLGKIPR